jgi:hypothetical protein
LRVEGRRGYALGYRGEGKGKRSKKRKQHSLFSPKTLPGIIFFYLCDQSIEHFAYFSQQII